MKTPTHPTYEGTDRKILIGDYVIEPKGPNETQQYPHVVTSVSKKYVTIRSIVSDAERTTYPMFIRPADQTLVDNVQSRLDEANVEAWKRRMREENTYALSITDPYSTYASRFHVIATPEGTTPDDIRLYDLLTPFTKSYDLGHYTRSSIAWTPIDQVRDVIQLDALVDSPVTRIDTPLRTRIDRVLEEMLQTANYESETFLDAARLITALASKTHEDFDARLTKRIEEIAEQADDWDEDWD